MSIADRVVEEARSWIGTRYAHQHSLKGVACDCLGLVRNVYTNVTGRPHEEPPPYTPDLAESNMKDYMLEAARKYLVERIDWEKGDPFIPGDVLIFRYRPTAACKHTGIVATPETFVHSYNDVGVREVTISAFWRKILVGVFYFPEV